MGKISIEDLANIRTKAQYQNTVRQGQARVKMTVHMGTCGIASGAREILLSVMREIESRGLHDVIITNAGCAGHCGQEPMMTVEAANEPVPVKYVLLTPDKIREIIDGHVMHGRILKEYTLAVRNEKTR